MVLPFMTKVLRLQPQPQLERKHSVPNFDDCFTKSQRVVLQIHYDDITHFQNLYLWKERGNIECFEKSTNWKVRGFFTKLKNNNEKTHSIHKDLLGKRQKHFVEIISKMKSFLLFDPASWCLKFKALITTGSSKCR